MGRLRTNRKTQITRVVNGQAVLQREFQKVFIHGNVHDADRQLSYLPPEENRLVPPHTPTVNAFAKPVQQLVRPDAGDPSRPPRF